MLIIEYSKLKSFRNLISKSKIPKLASKNAEASLSLRRKCVKRKWNTLIFHLRHRRSYLNCTWERVSSMKLKLKLPLNTYKPRHRLKTSILSGSKHSLAMLPSINITMRSSAESQSSNLSNSYTNSL